MKRYGNLISEIVSEANMNEAFDEVVGNLPTIKVYDKQGRLVKTINLKERYRKKRSEIIESVANRIRDGTFKVESFRELEVKDGPKVRRVQSPSVVDRVGVNAVMRVVEKYTYPTIVRTSAAAIKGRGMHRLYRKIRTDIRHDRVGTWFYYKSDIKKFYQNIDHKKMKQCIRRYIKDPLLLQILDGFIDLLEEGISIGLRSSQCFGNLLLSILDHRMKEAEHVRYYYRYCDDICVLAPTKEECWKAREIIHEETEKLGLTIKPNECVRPVTEGLDFLGFVDFGDHSRIRKRIKQNAARKLHKIRSRRRRREIIGSFKGMAKWGDCKNLYYKLTGKKMDEEFSSLGWQYQSEDGKKEFDGKGVTLRSLSNIKIKILDYEVDVKTQNGLRWVVSFQFEDGTKDKYFTDDKKQKFFLNKMREEGKLGKIWTRIKPVPFGNGKVRYEFS